MNTKDIQKNIQPDWWKSEGGFFGKKYMEADHSYEGFLDSPQDMPHRIEEEVEGVVRLCGLGSGSRILDCPSGYGRHSIGLAQNDHFVTGVDVNREHLGIAEKARNTLGLGNCEFRESDMRKLDFKEEFDALINMFYSFGFFEDEQDDELSVRNFYNALVPGGKFLMHTFITLPKIKAGHYKKHDVRTLVSGDKLELFREYVPETKREVGLWSILRQDGTREELAPYSMRIYTAEEFSDLCRRGGFKKVTAYGDWNGTPYKDKSELLIVVAEK